MHIRLKGARVKLAAEKEQTWMLVRRRLGVAAWFDGPNDASGAKVRKICSAAYLSPRPCFQNEVLVLTLLSETQLYHGP